MQHACICHGFFFRGRTGYAEVRAQCLTVYLTAWLFSKIISCNLAILEKVSVCYNKTSIMPAEAAKKTTTAKKTTKVPASHPPVAVMVTEAITALKERNGSSLPAIKKYVAGHFACDVDKLAPFIRKFLKKGVEEGKLKQIKASYKLDKTKVQKPKKKPTKKPAAKKAPAKPKKVKTPKKAAANPKADKPKKAEKAAKPKKTKTLAKSEKPKKKPAKKSPKKAAAKPKKPAAKKTPKKAAKKPVKK